MVTRHRQTSFLSEFVTSGLSVSIANVCTNPIDVVKVRMQLQALRVAGFTGQPAQAPGLLVTGANIVRHEGVLALYSGLSPAVARGLFYGGVRLGLYSPVKQLLGADEASPSGSFLRKVAAGCISGAVATAATNPIDLVKTRLQSKGGGSLQGPLAALRLVVKADGVRGLWRGTLPSSMRAAMMTASQCATYDEIKRAWMAASGWGDGLGTHLGASMVAGLVTTTVTAPVDVIKTRMFVGGAQYQGPWHCLRELLRREGPRGLFAGWTANYARLGPQTTIIFVVMERLRRLSGMDSL